MNEEQNQFEPINNTEVIELATNLMEEFDEAFEELAK